MFSLKPDQENNVTKKFFNLSIADLSQAVNRFILLIFYLCGIVSDLINCNTYMFLSRLFVI